MQQILNYTPKVERVQHMYQAQGEVNKVLLYEDFYEESEEAKDKVLQADETEEKLIQNEEKESSSGNFLSYGRKGKGEKEKEGEKYNKESTIDLKV